MFKSVLGIAFVTVLAVESRNCPGCNYSNPAGPSAALVSFTDAAAPKLGVMIVNASDATMMVRDLTCSAGCGVTVLKPGEQFHTIVFPTLVGTPYRFSYLRAGGSDLDQRFITCTKTKQPIKKDARIIIRNDTGACSGF